MHTINTIVIENSKLFSNFVSALIGSVNKENDDFIVYEDNCKKEISKFTDIIFNLFEIGANNSGLLKKLYEEIERDLNTDDMLLKRKLEMENKINEVLDELLYRSRFSLVTGELDYLLFFKSSGIEFDYEKNSTVERLTEYLNVSYNLTNKKLFIIVNLDSFLDKEDLIELKKFLRYNEIRVLALQNIISRETDSDENLRIVDKDLCEI